MLGGMSGRGDAEILEIGGGIDQHLAGAVVAVDVVALAGRHHLRPGGEIGSSSFGFCVKRL